MQDIEDYLDGVVTADALVVSQDLRHDGRHDPNLSADDMMALGARVRAYIVVGRIGPLAIVAAIDKSYQHARMFAALAVADRPVSKVVRHTPSRRRRTAGTKPIERYASC